MSIEDEKTFFFQAEDGIRDVAVTGVQTCALPISLSLRPKLIVLDEPTSALVVAVQAQVLNRLVALQEEFGFSYLLITHNVAAVRYVADRVAVMYLGKLAEVGPVRSEERRGGEECR